MSTTLCSPNLVLSLFKSKSTVVQASSSPKETGFEVLRKCKDVIQFCNNNNGAITCFNNDDFSVFNDAISVSNGDISFFEDDLTSFVMFILRW